MRGVTVGCAVSLYDCCMELLVCWATSLLCQIANNLLCILARAAARCSGVLHIGAAPLIDSSCAFPTSEVAYFTLLLSSWYTRANAAVAELRCAQCAQPCMIWCRFRLQIS